MTAESIKEVLTMRYSLLPYMYTTFSKEVVGQGIPLARTIDLEYPKEDMSLYPTQFNFGPALYVSLVFEVPDSYSTSEVNITHSLHFPANNSFFYLHNGAKVIEKDA